MNKKILGLILVSSILFLMSSCSTRDRLDLPTTQVIVSPSGSAVAVVDDPSTSEDETELLLTAKVIKYNGELLDKTIKWWVEGGSANGSITQTGVYTAPSSINNPMTVTINAEVDGVIGTAQIRVLQAIDNSTKTRYYFYMDDLPSDLNFKADTSNPSDPDGGYIGVWPSTNTVTLTNAYGSGEVCEGLEAMKIAVDSGYTGGVWFQFGYSSSTVVQSTTTIQINDLSAYTGGSLVFYVKTTDTNMKVSIMTGGSAGSAGTIYQIYVKDYISVNNTWQKCTVPLSDFTGSDLSAFKEIIFTINGKTAYIDNLYIEK